MFGAMSSTTSRRTGGPKRRRSSSFSRACSRFSASSSSTSRSSLRVTRKKWCSTISMPANRCSRCWAITSSSVTKRATRPAVLPARGPSTEISRGMVSGTFRRAKSSLPLTGLRTTTARFSESPEMYGKGWAGSTASGVRIGKTWSMNQRCSSCCARVSSSSQVVSRICSSSRAGRTCSAKTFAWRSCSACASLRIISSWSIGLMPAAEGTARPVAMRRLRPATRTMKNSSRFEAKIERKLTRSSRCRSGSSASSSTRALKCSQLSSRSRNLSSAKSPSGTGGGAEVGQLDPVLGRAGRRHVGEAQGGGDWLRVHGVCP